MDLINSVCESPLGLYVFGNDFQSVDWLIDRTSSGSAMANEALYQFFNWNVGFGGVRGSGNGKYSLPRNRCLFCNVSFIRKTILFLDLEMSDDLKDLKRAV